jgi:glycosyltransferase involved in cell wall biosynthesis
VVDILGMLDVFSMPSIDEGLPMAMLEAMAAGVPVVLSAVGEIPSVIKHRHNGLLTKPGDSEDIAFCLNELIEKPQLGLNLKINALKSVTSNYSNEAMGRRYCNLYENIMNVVNTPFA